MHLVQCYTWVESSFVFASSEKISMVFIDSNYSCSYLDNEPCSVFLNNHSLQTFSTSNLNSTDYSFNLCQQLWDLRHEDIFLFLLFATPWFQSASFIIYNLRVWPSGPSNFTAYLIFMYSFGRSYKFGSTNFENTLDAISVVKSNNGCWVCSCNNFNFSSFMTVDD